MQYYQVFTSAEQTAQAHRILDALAAKQLVLGGPVVGGPGKFLWNFKESAVPEGMREHKLRTVEQDYNYIITYTREDLKAELIDVAESTSLEEVCTISFLTNEELDWSCRHPSLTPVDAHDVRGETVSDGRFVDSRRGCQPRTWRSIAQPPGLNAREGREPYVLPRWASKNVASP